MKSSEKSWAVLSILFAFLISGCGKKSVDPAYMETITKAADAVCKCAELTGDAAVQCMGKAGSVNPKGPGGEPPGLYEEKLDDASRSKIEAARTMYSSCEAKIMHPPGG